MTLEYDKVMANSIVDLPFSYTHRDTMLYGLSIGLSHDPLDRVELPYTTDFAGPPRVVPTMATVLVPDMFPPDLGWDYTQVLHAEQRLTLHRPLPPAADLLVNKRITDVFDRGPKLGAMVLFEAEGRLKSDDTVLFSLSNTIIARGDGGFGGPNGKGPAPHRPPRREPDLSAELPTSRNQALYYRLNGDWNPLHADPTLAASVGFDAPILHGLCTYGVACHAILKTILNFDDTLITGFDARFSSPVLPGDTITTDMWQEGNIISFQCTAKERGVVVLKNGKCTLSV